MIERRMKALKIVRELQSMGHLDLADDLSSREFVGLVARCYECGNREVKKEVNRP